MRISDWSSDVCSSDLVFGDRLDGAALAGGVAAFEQHQHSLARVREPARHGDEFELHRFELLLVLLALELLHADSSLCPEWQAWPAMASLGFLPRGLVAGHAARDLEQGAALPRVEVAIGGRSEEHTSELPSLMRISYAVFCLKTNTHPNTNIITLLLITETINTIH